MVNKHKMFAVVYYNVYWVFIIQEHQKQYLCYNEQIVIEIIVDISELSIINNSETC